MIDIYLQCLIFLLGLSVGSFLNVCIYRIPRPDLSPYSPQRSFCPTCSHPIKARDNIPLLSYLLLRGKCRHCEARISAVYPAVEVGTAVLFVVMFYRFGVTLDFLHALIFVTLLIPIAVIDVRHYIIPNVISFPGMILGLGIVSVIAYQKGDFAYLQTRLIGFVAGGMGLWFVAIIGSKLLRKKAMGGGDIKLMALNGLFLGAWPALIIVLALSALSGAVIGTLLIVIGKRSRESPIPYGPFLAIAAVMVLLWGNPLWETYLHLVGWR